MFRFQYLHANYLDAHWTCDPLQYPHIDFKHTLDLGPNQMQYLHFKLKHTLDLGLNQMQYLHFKLKHTLNMGPIPIIPIFRTNNYI
jgi:hypothetical protein